MKIRMIKELRKSLIIITVLILIITIIYLIYSIKTPKKITQELIVYQTKSNTNLDYQVKLIPNPIYDVEYLESGKTYISTFTDFVDITFQYNFTGNKTFHIKGNYIIELQMEGYSGKDKNFKSLWIKKYPPIKNEEFEVDSKQHNLTEHIPVILTHYLDFAKKLQEEANISSNKRLKIICTTNVEATVEDEIVNEKYNNTMIIPLTKDYYDITGQLEDKKETPIIKTTETVIPIQTWKIIVLCLFILLMALSLCYCIFFVVPYEISSKEKEINTIFKKHGSRIVTVQTEVDIIGKTLISMYSFNDLVKISDELIKPILYTHKKSKENITNFYVINDEINYYYSINNDDKILYETSNIQSAN